MERVKLVKNVGGAESEIDVFADAVDRLKGLGWSVKQSEPAKKAKSSSKKES